MGSTVFTGHQSQPQDVARQPFPVFDSALSAPSGVSALPGVSALTGLSGVSAFSGQSIHSVAVHGDTPMKVEMGSALAGPLGSPAMPDSRGFSLPGISLLSGAQPSLSGVRPPRDSPAPLWCPGNFQGRGKRQPSGRHRPSTLVGLGRCPTGQRPP